MYKSIILPAVLYECEVITWTESASKQNAEENV